MNAGMTDKKPAGPATRSADYNHPDADIVLVSQDNMSFHVMDYYLLASRYACAERCLLLS